MVLVLATAAILGVRLWIGCPAIMYGSHDSVLALSYAERIVEGQRPGRDFYTGGVALSLPNVLGILVVGCRGLALTIGHLLLAPLVVCVGWQFTRTRMSALTATAISLMLLMMMVTTNGPGGFSGTHAMQYNRVGWVLLCLVGIQTLLPARERASAGRVLFEGMVVGAALSCLAFGKLNYLAREQCAGCWD